MFAALRAAVRTARRRGLRIAHFAILSNHLHLLLETDDNRSLPRTLQSLGISLARRVNALLGARGSIFQDRYHLEVLYTPTQVRNAIHYAMTNEPMHELRNEKLAIRRDKIPRNSKGSRRRSGESPRAKPRVTPKDALKRLTFNLFSSAAAFDGWRALYGVDFRSITTAPAREIGDWIDEAIAPPRTWLLSVGWKRAGVIDSPGMNQIPFH